MKSSRLIASEVVGAALVSLLVILFVGNFNEAKILVENFRDITLKSESGVKLANLKREYKNSFEPFLKNKVLALHSYVIAENPIIPIKISDVTFDQPSLSAQAAAVVDLNTDTVLFSKKIDKRWPVASITKLMTAVVLLDRIRFDSAAVRDVTLSAGDIRDGKNFINLGETISWTDAFNSMIAGSSNTLAVLLTNLAIKDHGTWQMLINNKLLSWGLQKTQIREPSGISPGNISTAYEVAMIFKNSIRYDEILSALKTPQYYIKVKNSGEERRVDNTNWFLIGNIDTDFKTIPITKTGYIPESMYNLVGLFEKDGNKVIAVILGSSSHYSRFDEAEKIVDWVFENYSWNTGSSDSLLGG